MLPIQTVPPRGAIASPKTVMISDPARIVGRELNSETRDRVALFRDTVDSVIRTMPVPLDGTLRHGFFQFHTICVS